MRTLIVIVALLVAASSAAADTDLSVGVFAGMNVPVVNEDMEQGKMFGVQARLSFLGFLGIGGFYHSRGAGDPEQTFFAGTPFETVMEKDGGDLKAYGAEAYLGQSGGSDGVNVFFVGSVAKYEWTRENLEKVSQIAYAVGPGLEIVLPVGIGIEGRAMFEVVPTEDEDASWKNFVWWLGLNYHFGLLGQ